MSDHAPPRLFDLHQIVQHRDRAAANFDQFSFLKDRACAHLIERLGDVSRTFETILDVGCHTGQVADALARDGRGGAITALDPSREFLSLVQNAKTRQADFETLDLPAGAFDLVTSLLSLHWANDLPGTLVQIQKGLRPDGLFLAALFGAGSLAELRTAMMEAEIEHSGGASPRISPLPSLQDMAGLLQRAGFALPVADIDHVTVRYDHPIKLMQDLRGMAEQAAFKAREAQPRRPLTRPLLDRMSEIYFDRFADPDGRIRASFEIIWLSGWAPAPDQPKPAKRGSGKFSLAEAVKSAAHKGEPD